MLWDHVPALQCQPPPEHCIGWTSRHRVPPCSVGGPLAGCKDPLCAQPLFVLKLPQCAAVTPSYAAHAELRVSLGCVVRTQVALVGLLPGSPKEPPQPPPCSPAAPHQGPALLFASSIRRPDALDGAPLSYVHGCQGLLAMQSTAHGVFSPSTHIGIFPQSMHKPVTLEAPASTASVLTYHCTSGAIGASPLRVSLRAGTRQSAPGGRP